MRTRNLSWGGNPSLVNAVGLVVLAVIRVAVLPASPRPFFVIHAHPFATFSLQTSQHRLSISYLHSSPTPPTPRPTHIPLLHISYFYRPVRPVLPALFDITYSYLPSSRKS